MFRNFEYLTAGRSHDKPNMTRQCHTVESYPPDLHKKVTLLKYFKGYMQQNLDKVRIIIFLFFFLPLHPFAVYICLYFE